MAKRNRNRKIGPVEAANQKLREDALAKANAAEAELREQRETAINQADAALESGDMNTLMTALGAVVDAEQTMAGIAESNASGFKIVEPLSGQDITPVTHARTGRPPRSNRVQQVIEQQRAEDAQRAIEAAEQQAAAPTSSETSAAQDAPREGQEEAVSVADIAQNQTDDADESVEAEGVTAEVAAEEKQPVEPQGEPDISARASAPSRDLTDAGASDVKPDASDEALAAAKAAAIAEKAPKKPIGLWVGPKTELRDAKSPLMTVLHVSVPTGKRKQPVVGQSIEGSCGVSYMVDVPRVTAGDFTGDTDLPKCGWCLKVTNNETIPAYDGGKRRPVLPNAAEARAMTPPPVEELAPEVADLMSDNAFDAALEEIETIVGRIAGEEKWVPTADEFAAIVTRQTTVREAHQARVRRAAALAEAIAATKPKRTRNVTRTPRQTVDGTASELGEQRFAGKLLPTLFRTLDPIGPFLVGYRSAGGPQWIVRNTAPTNGESPDAPSFGDNKAAALAYATEKLADMKLTAEETARLAEVARGRMQAGDALKRSR